MSETICESVLVPKKAEGSVRLVSNNILQQAVINSVDRLNGLIYAFGRYDADVFTLQEVDPIWRNDYKIADEMAKIGYALATDNDKLATPVYYKTDRFNLVDGGYQMYDLTGLAEQSKRAFCWACLEEKDTGKRLIVTSTHLISQGNKATSDEEKANRELHRQACAKQLPKAVGELSKKYGGAPAVMAGDFNSYCDSATYAILSSELNSARELCPSKVNMDYRTSGSVKRAPKMEPGMAIDHVFYTKCGITPQHYEAFIADFSYAYSDHIPMMFDFELD